MNTTHVRVVIDVVAVTTDTCLRHLSLDVLIVNATIGMFTKQVTIFYHITEAGLTYRIGV